MKNPINQFFGEILRRGHENGAKLAGAIIANDGEAFAEEGADEFWF